MGESFDLLAEEGVVPTSLAARMRAAVGFRNIAVHNYQAADWDIVHAITHEGLDDFRDFARHIAALIDDEPPN